MCGAKQVTDMMLSLTESYVWCQAGNWHDAITDWINQVMAPWPKLLGYMKFVLGAIQQTYSFLGMQLLIHALTLNSLRPSDAIWRQIWVNIGSGNGLLPDGTKPLPKPMLT